MRLSIRSPLITLNFIENIFKYINVTNVLITYFHDEAKINGVSNILWPWLNQKDEEIPTRYGAKDLFSQSQIVGNLYEGISK